jgi:murein DD-endopeptidase MepM/ murein hydrolase activator NlpD
MFCLFVFTALSAALPLKLGAEDAVHVVARGETVYSISRSYRISSGDLMKHNGISDASKLQVGARLKIPPVNTSAAALPAAPAAGYLVVKDDTLYSIARRHGISVEALRSLNGFGAGYVLKAGDRIKVPATAAETAARPAEQPAAAQKAVDPAAARQTAQKAVDASLRWPVQPRELAYMTGKLYGVVLQGERTEPVKSLTQGTVISAGPYRGFGRVAIVQVTGGYLYVYGGCESLSVKEGDRIGPGTELGKLGIDAVSSKPQLFFLVYRNNTPIDPALAPRA